MTVTHKRTYLEMTMERRGEGAVRRRSARSREGSRGKGIVDWHLISGRMTATAGAATASATAAASGSIH